MPLPPILAVDNMAKQNQITLIADQRILTIPIIENNEPLIDLKDQYAIAFGPSPEIPNNQDYTKIRLTIYKKLQEAQKLLPDGLFFCLYEGYRSLETQKMLFDQHYIQLSKLHPEWTTEQCFQGTTKLVSPVINADGSANIPPHSTGGAFDIYLIDAHGTVIDMGLYVKDWMSDTDGKLSATNSPYISESARTYRKIMHDALTSVGFINYPTEYWHWSYGDRYWAYHTNNTHAIYNSI